MPDFARVSDGKGLVSTKGEDGFASLLPVTNVSLEVLLHGAEMKSFAAAVAFACFSGATHPAVAGDEWLGQSPKLPGWEMKYAETETYFLYCVSPKICGEGSIISFHFHDLPAPSKADIRAKQKEPRLPITCQRIGKYDSCEYPAAIDKKGQPTHWRPTPAPGFKADFFHVGFLSERLPAGSPYKMLITISSSAKSYRQAKKNYALFRSSLPR